MQVGYFFTSCQGIITARRATPNPELYWQFLEPAVRAKQMSNGERLTKLGFSCVSPCGESHDAIGSSR
jgi:hypothetical protein